MHSLTAPLSLQSYFLNRYWHPEAKELAQRPSTTGPSLASAADAERPPPVAAGKEALASDSWAQGTAANVRKLATVERDSLDAVAKSRTPPAATLPWRQKRPTLKATLFPAVLSSDGVDTNAQRARANGTIQARSDIVASSGVLHLLNLSERVVHGSSRSEVSASEGCWSVLKLHHPLPRD